MSTLLQAPPLALYVHLPWCVRKCPYCDFNSHAAPAVLPYRAYIDALLADLKLDSERVRGRSISSIFFGGGTPSLFPPEQIELFLSGVRTLLPVETDAEITLEANPGTIERGRFIGYRAAGVNRVSLGAQSFNPAQLRRLGRIHEAEDVGQAVRELRLAGIENFNLDLMYALPEQSLEDALHDLRSAIELGPTHLSHYQLTLEPGTVFYHRPPPLPDHEAAWEIQQRCQEELASAGYMHYEVSAYARSRRECIHNLNYWRFGDYLGIGAGAHGKITDLQQARVLRTVRAKQPRDYLTRSVAERVETSIVPASDLPFEFMLNALRLVEGFDTTTFEASTGLRWRSIDVLVGRAQERGLIDSSREGWCRPTELGLRFLNELQGMFLPASPVPKSFAPEQVT